MREIIGVPFESSIDFNPILNIISQLKPDQLCSLYLIQQERKIKCFIHIPSELSELFDSTINLAGYIAKESPISFNCFSTHMLLRNIPLTGAAVIPTYDTDPSKLNTLLSRLLQFSEGSGIAFYVKGRKAPTKALVNFKSKKATLKPMIDKLEMQGGYSFWCNAISNNPSEEKQIADLVSSCIQGFQILPRDTSISITSTHVPHWSSYSWKNELSISATIEEMEAVFSFFILLGNYGISRNRDTSINTQLGSSIHTNDQLGSPQITIGHTFSNHFPIGLDLISIRQNIFIAGAPGTGKGNLFVTLAKQLYDQGVSFLFIESAKKELHHLRKIIPSLKVWRPEAGGFVLNPFSIPEDLTYGEYDHSLQTILHTCFDIDHEGSALTRLFPEALEQCFYDMGYDHDSTNFSPNVHPFGINEFASTYNQLLDMQKYHPKEKQNIRQAGLNRITSLYENRYVFDSIHSIPIRELTTGFNVLQLSPLSSTSSKQFFATLLLVQINAWLTARFHNIQNKDLNLVIAIDESHNLFQSVSNTHGEEYSFVSDFSRNLLEHRSSGIGYIIADQSARNLPPQIIQSCATKIFLGANLDSGIKDYLLELYMNEEQLHNLYSFKAGDGIFYTYGLKSGLSFHSDDSISNLHVYEVYDTDNSFLSKTRITIETYQECSTCPMRGKCDIKMKQRATMLAERYYYLHRDDILEKYFSAKQENNKQQCNEYGKKLVQTLQDTIGEENDAIYCCFIQQLLRHYKREYKNMQFVNGTTKFINTIIEKRRKRNTK